MRRYRSEAKVKVSYMRQRLGNGRTAARASSRSRGVNITFPGGQSFDAVLLMVSRGPLDHGATACWQPEPLA